MKLKKSKCAVFGIGHHNPNEEYILNSALLFTGSQQSDLGVIGTSQKEANSFVYLIQCTFKDHSIEMIWKLYKSYVRPKLEYTYTVWNPYYIKDIEILKKIQRRVIKIPTVQLQNMSYTERLAKFQLKTLRERRHREDLIETFKITSGHYTCDVNTIFSSNQNQ